jgi:hypothetical protein
MYENDERYQLDATIMIYYHKLSLHFLGIYTCSPEDGHIDARNM